jgi:hypothetical protein
MVRRRLFCKSAIHESSKLTQRQTTATNWLLNFIIAFITPYMVDVDRGNLQSRVFFIWGSFW